MALPVKLTCSNFMRIRSHNQPSMTSNQATLELYRLSGVRELVVRIFVGTDECVGLHDIFFRNADVQCPLNEVAQACATLDEAHDGGQVASCDAITRRDSSLANFHGSPAWVCGSVIPALT